MVPSVVFGLRIAAGIGFVALAGFLAWRGVEAVGRDGWTDPTFPWPDNQAWLEARPGALISCWADAAAAGLAATACLTGQQDWWYAAGGFFLVGLLGLSITATRLTSNHKRWKMQRDNKRQQARNAGPGDAGQGGLPDAAEDPDIAKAADRVRSEAPADPT